MHVFDTHDHIANSGGATSQKRQLAWHILIYFAIVETFKKEPASVWHTWLLVYP